MDCCACAISAVFFGNGSVSEDLRFVDGAVDIQKIAML